MGGRRAASAAGSPCGRGTTRPPPSPPRYTPTACAVDLADGATNGGRFRAYVTDTLAPVLRHGDTVILDNLGAHKVAGRGREAIEAGARLLYLPPDSPDFNPIEQVFSKLKRLLQTKAARIVADLWAAIQQALTCFTAQKCRNDLAAGFDDDVAVAT